MKRPQRVLSVREEVGQTAVEYAMLIGALSLVTILVVAAAAPGWLSSLTGHITDAL